MKATGLNNHTISGHASLAIGSCRKGLILCAGCSRLVAFPDDFPTKGKNKNGEPYYYKYCRACVAERKRQYRADKQTVIVAPVEVTRDRPQGDSEIKVGPMLGSRDFDKGLQLLLEVVCADLFAGRGSGRA